MRMVFASSIQALTVCAAGVCIVKAANTSASGRWPYSAGSITRAEEPGGKRILAVAGSVADALTKTTCADVGAGRKAKSDHEPWDTRFLIN